MHGVALTSLWVDAWRAAESERPDALFHDPFARELARPEGFAVLEDARAVAPIEAPTIPVRTRFFDQRVARSVHVVLLAEFVQRLGAPWKVGTDEPEALLEPLGWTITAHDLGTLAAEAGRWPWPVVPRTIPEVSRAFSSRQRVRRGHDGDGRRPPS